MRECRFYIIAYHIIEHWIGACPLEDNDGAKCVINYFLNQVQSDIPGYAYKELSGVRQ